MAQKRSWRISDLTKIFPMRKILFTKKNLDNKLISKELGGKLMVDLVEVLSIENLKIPHFDLKNRSLIFTSVKAVDAFFENKFLPNENFTDKNFNKIYVVGKKSKKALQKKGFGTFKVKKNAEELAEFIIKNCADETFLHFCGNLSLETLENKLNKENIGYKKVIVYKTKLKYPIVKNPFDEIVFFSPSGVRSFLKYNSIKGKKIFSIGRTTSQEIEKDMEEKIYTSTESNLEDILQMILQKL